MLSVITTYPFLLFPLVIFLEISSQPLPTIQQQTCSIATDLRTAIDSAPYILQDIIIEFPSRLKWVLKDPAVVMAVNDQNRAVQINNLLKHYSDFDQKYHLASTSLLNPTRSEVHSFWINNVISVTRVSRNEIYTLASVVSLESCVIRMAVVSSTQGVSNQYMQTSSTVWIPPSQIIGAEVAWNAGFYGKGVHVAVIDTGVNLAHTSLQGKCGPWLDVVDDQKMAVDPNGHGTAVASLIVGYRVGIAPQADLIACRAGDAHGNMQHRHVLACAQWIAELYLSPIIVCNAWTAQNGGNTYFNGAIQVWDSLGIHHVFPIGNSGPNCGSTRSPGDQEVAFSVGSVDNNDQPAPDSSRGPNPIQYNLKPDIAAPGVDINMAGPDNPFNYIIHSGTSFAAAHTAGAMALLLSRFVPAESIEKQTRELREALISYARVPTPATSSQQTQIDRCCFNAGKDYPHAAMGQGLLNLNGFNF